MSMMESKGTREIDNCSRNTLIIKLFLNDTSNSGEPTITMHTTIAEKPIDIGLANILSLRRDRECYYVHIRPKPLVLPGKYHVREIIERDRSSSKDRNV